MAEIYLDNIRIYGFVLFLFFIYNPDSQKLYLSSNEEKTLMLERKKYWGLTKEIYELKFVDTQWKWRKENGTKTLSNGMEIIEYGEWKSAELSYDVLDIDNLGYDFRDE